MEEGRVTIEGETLDLPRPFVVCATQNPIEFEGTYPLPEAQLDRFLLKLLLGYPDVAAETEILRRYQAGFRPRELDRALGAVEPIVSAPEALAMQEEAAAVAVHEDVLGYVAELAAWLRASPDVIVGPSPRGSIALVLTAKVMAAARGGRLRHAGRPADAGAGRAAAPDRAVGRRRARRRATPTTVIARRARRGAGAQVVLTRRGLLLFAAAGAGDARWPRRWGRPCSGSWPANALAAGIVLADWLAADPGVDRARARAAAAALDRAPQTRCRCVIRNGGRGARGA